MPSELKYAIRTFLKNPTFTIVCVLTLALGIGANTAVFSVVFGVLVKALPYKDPQQLVLLFEQLPGAPNRIGFSPPDFEIVRSLARSYSGFAAYRTNGYELSGSVTPQRLTGARVSPELFSVLGVVPMLGRSLTDDDDRQNARVAVVSHGLWTRLFGRDPSVVGRTISLDGRSYTVVGILPERFVFPPRGADLNGEPADVFVPMSFSPFERQQFAVALVLSVAAGLLVRSFVRLVQTDPGFSPEQAVRATVTLPVGRYGTPPQVKTFYQQSIEAARAIPGILSVGAGDDLPLSVRERRAFSADPSGRPIPDPSRVIAPTWTVGAYFDALRIPLKRGRFFTDADGAATQRVAIVNERLARLVWPDTDPVGHQIRWGIDIPQNRNPWMTIVGVVGDVKQAGLDTPAIAQVYVPVLQDDSGAGLLRTVNIVARSTRDAESVMADLRNVVQRFDNLLPMTVQAVDDMVGASVQPQRFSMNVMMLFAALALILAALGIYGVLSNAVAQRTQEIGVRVALGATRRDVMWMILGRAMLLIGTGFVIGTAGALAATRTMAGLLFDVRPTDVASFLGATASLAVVAVLASLAPAWRAARVDPIVALRAE